MRTTLTLDDDIAGILQRRSRELGTSFKDVVNSVLRKGLTAELKLSEKRPEVVVRPHDFGSMHGVDMDRLNQLVDELEVEDFLRKARNDSARRKSSHLRS
jgi:hypothetical protein